jgi:hypothetical protein
MERGLLIGFILAVVVSLAFPLGGEAAVVGHFTEVEGAVDLLKGGKVPTVPAKVQDGVEVGDVVRTKSQSRAQVKFVDDTTLAIGAESRVAIESYIFDAAKSQRQAVLQVFRGLVHTLVTRIIKTEEPDFLIKTHTAIIGVRGTSTYTSLSPTGTDIYNESGKVRGSNLLPEVPGFVEAGPMQYFQVASGLPPTVPMPFTMEDLGTIKSRLTPRVSGVSTGGAPGGPTGLVSGGVDTAAMAGIGTGTQLGAGTTWPTAANPTSLVNPVNSLSNPVNTVTTPPQPLPTSTTSSTTSQTNFRSRPVR